MVERCVSNAHLFYERSVDIQVIDEERYFCLLDRLWTSRYLMDCSNIITGSFKNYMNYNWITLVSLEYLLY